MTSESKLGIDYVMYDANWYGKDQTSDATKIRQPNLDIKAVAAYAHAHDMRFGLYIDARQATKQLPTLLPLFKDDWQVDYLKIGFVQVGSQADTAWCSDTVEETAKHHLMLNLHDGYRQTGICRTYPNLLTVEGIRGNEHMPTAEHNCTLPFTRYVLGPGDYTVCYMNSRIQTTPCASIGNGGYFFQSASMSLLVRHPGHVHRPERRGTAGNGILASHANGLGRYQGSQRENRGVRNHCKAKRQRTGLWVPLMVHSPSSLTPRSTS